MDLDLRFDGLTEDVLDAVADVRIDDLAMADAPSGPDRTTSAPFTVSPDRPSLRLSVEVRERAGAYEPGLIVTVRGRTADGRRVEFLNTAATRLPGTGEGPVRVALSRIS
jgi:hypothetical protein